MPHRREDREGGFQRRRAVEGSRASGATSDEIGKGQVMAEGFVHTVHPRRSLAKLRRGRSGTFCVVLLESKETAVVAGGVEAQRRRTVHVIHHEDGKLSERQAPIFLHQPRLLGQPEQRSPTWHSPGRTIS